MVIILNKQAIGYNKCLNMLKIKLFLIYNQDVLKYILAS